jgi:hypothetical protein
VKLTATARHSTIDAQTLKALFVACAASLLVISCGSSSPSATVVTPTPVPTPALTQAQLGAQYLAMVAPDNKLVDAMNVATRYPALMNLTKVRRIAAALEAADITFNTDLIAFGLVVPAAIRPDVAAARLAVSSDIAELQNVVGSKNHAALDANVNAWIAVGDRDTKAFILLRSDLGLAPPPA